MRKTPSGNFYSGPPEAGSAAVRNSILWLGLEVDKDHNGMLCEQRLERLLAKLV